MENITPLLRFLFIIPVSLIGLGIFSLLVRRGGLAFGICLRWKTIVVLAIGLLFLLISSMRLGTLPGKIPGIVGTSILWIITAFLALSPLFIGRDIISLLYKLPPVVMFIVSVVWIGTGVFYGTQTKITQVTMTSDRLQENKKIVFISDLHVDTFRQTKYIQQIVDEIQKLNPDLVLLGGDLMNYALPEYTAAFLPFKQLTMPMYATLGNHDHMGNTRALSGIFSQTPIIPLRNQSIEVQGIQIVGIDDKSYRGGKKITDILDESKIIDKGQFTILVSHQPEQLQKLAGYPIDLELAGHTHNGQFWPMSLIIKLFNAYSYGSYQYQGKTAFISQGIGTWGVPLRIGTQSEIVLISLQGDKK